MGVSASTIPRWEEEDKLIPERTLGNQRIYNDSHLAIAKRLKTGKYPHRIVVYWRVSSNSQKDDLLPSNTGNGKILLLVRRSASQLATLRKVIRVLCSFANNFLEQQSLIVQKIFVKLSSLKIV